MVVLKAMEPVIFPHYFCEQDQKSGRILRLNRISWLLMILGLIFDSNHYKCIIIAYLCNITLCFNEKNLQTR